jgi:hypothetical protein
MTSKQQLLLASSALFALALAPAWAGPCTDQIADAQKAMSSMDAGSGPTMGASPGHRATTTSSTLPAPGASAGAAGASAPGQSTAAAGSSATVPNVSANPAQTPRAGEAPKTDATVAMNTASQGRATSAQDVRSQQQGQPTSAQIAQGGAQPGAGGTQPQADKMMQVNAALDRARAADQRGDNAGCTQALGEAKQLVGNR